MKFTLSMPSSHARHAVFNPRRVRLIAWYGWAALLVVCGLIAIRAPALWQQHTHYIQLQARDAAQHQQHASAPAQLPPPRDAATLSATEAHAITHALDAPWHRVLPGIESSIAHLHQKPQRASAKAAGDPSARVLDVLSIAADAATGVVIITGVTPQTQALQQFQAQLRLEGFDDLQLQSVQRVSTPVGAAQRFTLQGRWGEPLAGAERLSGAPR